MPPQEITLTHQELRVFAHDVRNLLGGINNYAQLLQMLVAKQGLEQEESAAQSIIEIVHKIDELFKVRIDTQKL